LKLGLSTKLRYNRSNQNHQRRHVEYLNPLITNGMVNENRLKFPAKPYIRYNEDL